MNFINNTSQHRRISLTSRSHRKNRHGMVGVMFVVVFSLLIGTFVFALGRRSLAERQRDVQRQTVHLLESAIDSAARADLSVDQTLRFPVDQSSEDWVEVRLLEPVDGERRFRATHLRGERTGMFITRSESRSAGGE